MTSHLIARRMGRIAFGGVVLLGLAYLVCSGEGPMHWPQPWHIAPTLIATWSAAFAAYFLVRAVATRRWIGGARDRWFAASMIVPSVAIALALPITLHIPFVVALTSVRDFDGWFLASAMFSGPAHLVAAFMVGGRARQLVADKRAWSPATIIAMTVAVSCIPFIVLFAIPPVLVAITALPFVPLLRYMAVLVRREREEMAALPELPEARVI